MAWENTVVVTVSPEEFVRAELEQGGELSVDTIAEIATWKISNDPEVQAFKNGLV